MDAPAEVCSCLRRILREELRQGNAVESSVRSDWLKGNVLAFLEQSFHRAYRFPLKLPWVRYLHVHDPHYWEDEYHCWLHGDCVATSWPPGPGCPGRPDR